MQYLATAGAAAQNASAAAAQAQQQAAAILNLAQQPHLNPQQQQQQLADLAVKPDEQEAWAQQHAEVAAIMVELVQAMHDRLQAALGNAALQPIALSPGSVGAAAAVADAAKAAYELWRDVRKAAIGIVEDTLPPNPIHWRGQVFKSHVMGLIGLYGPSIIQIVVLLCTSQGNPLRSWHSAVHSAWQQLNEQQQGLGAGQQQQQLLQQPGAQPQPVAAVVRMLVAPNLALAGAWLDCVLDDPQFAAAAG
jgi:hypothetical protein